MISQDKSLYLRAIYYAGSLHQKQLYGEYSYFQHLLEVDKMLASVGYPEESTERITGWLHDVVEDCSQNATREISYIDIGLIFGDNVRQACKAITNEDGENRKEKFIKTSSKIRANKSAYVVKLADRNCNMIRSLQNLKTYGITYYNEIDFFQSQMGRKTYFLDFRIAALWTIFDNVSVELENQLGKNKMRNEA